MVRLKNKQKPMTREIYASINNRLIIFIGDIKIVIQYRMLLNAPLFICELFSPELMFCTK